jgi:hypothetical protein
MSHKIDPATLRGRARSFSLPTATFVRATLAAASLIGLLALTLSLASAQQDRGALQEACQADYRRLCPTVTAGGGRILKCLNENLASLSEPCKQAIGTRKAN